jgi:putative metallohydrolase (TIGR04338 family)
MAESAPGMGGMHGQERKKIRDSQRKRVYDAERDVPQGLAWDSIVGAQRYVDRLLATPWWQQSFPSVWYVVVLDGGPRRYSDGDKGVDAGVIKLSSFMRNQLTILHELAHIARPAATAGHGPEFAGIYLFLVRQCMGNGVAAKLACNFDAHRVKVQDYAGPRHHYFEDLWYFGGRWVVPPASGDVGGRVGVRLRQGMARLWTCETCGDRRPPAQMWRRPADAPEIWEPYHVLCLPCYETAMWLEMLYAAS